MKELDSIAARREVMAKVGTVVVKAGTRLLTDEGRVQALVAQIAAVRGSGTKVVLVSSGAVGMGMGVLELKKRPARLAEVQALAAIGQIKLMSVYEAACRAHGFHAAQLLLTADDLRHRERHLNVMNCVSSLWAAGALPIVNENDSVSVDELKFGDNDQLAARLAVTIRADLTIILTTVDGLLSPDGKGGFGGRISLVPRLDAHIRGLAGGSDDTAMSIGGMASKLDAAAVATASGEPLWIADGRGGDVLAKIFAAEDVGTLFLPGGGGRMRSRKRWIGFFSSVRGRLLVDGGARRAVAVQGGSLLSSGVKGVEGNFKRGDTVEIVESGSAAGFARGVSNFAADEARLLAGAKSEEIPSILGRPADAEIVHRDNLAVIASVE